MLEFLKPKWSEGKMTEEDRARRFWILKSFTSYTAWKRCRDRYAVFVDLLERQCKEEPVGRMGRKEMETRRASVRELIEEGTLDSGALARLENIHITHWRSDTYADALRGLSLYDQALAKLKHGDHSVFLRSSQGLLEDAYNAAHRQFEMYYMGGPKGGDGMVFYGKYVPAMKAALLWANQNGGFNAGGLQPAMADLSASCVWINPHDEPNPRGGKLHLEGTHVWLQEGTAHLKQVPPTLVPVEDVSAFTGEPCPVFGIYEPQVRDGMMNYMCQGQKAYRYGMPVSAPGAGTSVAWKLIWEDTRYRDGMIPEEEKDYYPESNTPPDFSHLVGEELTNDWNSNQVVVQHSGEPAAYTGTWAAQIDLGGRIFWRRGDPLPPHRGASVDWVYSGV